MNRVSILIMKSLRRFHNRFSSWYYTTSFLSNLEEYGEHINVSTGGKINLWNAHVVVGSYAHFYPGVTLWGPGKIKIGCHTEIGLNCVIYSSEYVEIGNNSLLAANCYIIDSNHGIAKDEIIRNQKAIVKGPVIIGEDVWLGAGVKVLSGVQIGKGAVIGAGAVVNSHIPEYAIAVGVPAKVIGYRQ